MPHALAAERAHVLLANASAEVATSKQQPKPRYTQQKGVIAHLWSTFTFLFSCILLCVLKINT